MDRIQQTGTSKSRRRGQGCVVKLPSGSWDLKWYGPADQNGKKKRFSLSVKCSKKEAQKRLNQKLAEIDSNRHVDKSKETVTKFMARFMATHVARNCTLRTAQGYQGYIDRHINPNIGSIVLQKLTIFQIDALYGNMLANGLSGTTILQLHRILKKSFNWGIQTKVLNGNPADGATPPKKSQHQMEMWDVPTINQFLELSHGTRFGDLYSFAVRTGLRRSEICGLKWESVDLPSGDGENGSLSVVGVLHRLKGYGLKREEETKTNGSRRPVRLSPDVVDLLRQVKGTQQLQQIEYGSLWNNTGYVFTNQDGSPIIPDQITQDFARIIKRNGLPHLTFHGLRHTFATLGLKKGINPKVVSEALGHSKVGITLDIYSHVIPAMQDELVNAVSDILSGGG